MNTQSILASRTNPSKAAAKRSAKLNGNSTTADVTLAPVTAPEVVTVARSVRQIAIAPERSGEGQKLAVIAEFGNAMGFSNSWHQHINQFAMKLGTVKSKGARITATASVEVQTSLWKDARVLVHGFDDSQFNTFLACVRALLAVRNAFGGIPKAN